MEINYDIIAKILLGFIGYGVFSDDCEKEIIDFSKTRDMNVFSLKSRQEINGVFVLTIRPAYQTQTGKYIPNIFIKEEDYND